VLNGYQQVCYQCNRLVEGSTTRYPPSLVSSPSLTHSSTPTTMLPEPFPITPSTSLKLMTGALHSLSRTPPF